MPQHSLTSIVIPCHNYGGFLGEALQSIQAQSWSHWECIIIDDGSTDHTESIARDFVRADPRIRYIHQHRQGVSAARNTGIAASSGAYLQFLDADDRIECDKLACQVAYMEAHPDIDLVYGDVRYFVEGGPEPRVAVSQRLPFPELPAAGDRLMESLVRRNIMVVNAPLLRRSALDAVGRFDPQLRGHEDWDLWLRLAMSGKTFRFLRASNSNALVRVHSNSTVQNVEAMLQSHLEVRHRLSFSLQTPGLKRINRYRMAIQYARVAKIELRNRRIKAAWCHIRGALTHSKGDPRVLVYLCTPEGIATKVATWVDRMARRPLPGISLPTGRR